MKFVATNFAKSFFFLRLSSLRQLIIILKEEDMNRALVSENEKDKVNHFFALDGGKEGFVRFQEFVCQWEARNIEVLPIL